MSDMSTVFFKKNIFLFNLIHIQIFRDVWLEGWRLVLTCIIYEDSLSLSHTFIVHSSKFVGLSELLYHSLHIG